MVVEHIARLDGPENNRRGNAFGVKAPPMLDAVIMFDSFYVGIVVQSTKFFYGIFPSYKLVRKRKDETDALLPQMKRRCKLWAVNGVAMCVSFWRNGE